MWLKKQIQQICNNYRPNNDRVDRIVKFTEEVSQQEAYNFDRYKYANNWDNFCTNKYINIKDNRILDFWQLYYLYKQETNLKIEKMTNQNKVEQASKLLLEVIKSEKGNDNLNDSSLKFLNKDLLAIIVDYWYSYESEIFVSENTNMEIDEYLNVEEIRF